MTRYSKIFEFLYPIVAILAAIEAYTLWDTNRSKAFLFIFFVVVSVGMFIFKRHYRKKFEQRKQE
jgi:positive regulator of sigma E activity|tara:strand:- start:31684 stop:31878 length:195 start_codon:yes stop_codon:yes gene_type:complete